MLPRRLAARPRPKTPHRTAVVGRRTFSRLIQSVNRDSDSSARPCLSPQAPRANQRRSGLVVGTALLERGNNGGRKKHGEKADADDEVTHVGLLRHPLAGEAGPPSGPSGSPLNSNYERRTLLGNTQFVRGYHLFVQRHTAVVLAAAQYGNYLQWLPRR